MILEALKDIITHVHFYKIYRSMHACMLFYYVFMCLTITYTQILSIFVATSYKMSCSYIYIYNYSYMLCTDVFAMEVFPANGCNRQYPHDMQ